MEQNGRLLLAIALSIAILLGFQVIYSRINPEGAKTPAPALLGTSPGKPVQTAPAAAPPEASAVASLSPSPRLVIVAPRLAGSLALRGLRLDDLVLRDYHETTDPHSPLVRLLDRLRSATPYYVQFGWSAPAGATVALPGPDTVWQASAETLTPASPVTLTWDNGAGLRFAVTLGIDDDYMFTIRQSVTNTGAAPVTLFPWARIRRDYTPPTSGYYILHEGLLGVIDGTLKELTYAKAKSEGERTGGVPFSATTRGGWLGITDKYWLTALVLPNEVEEAVAFRDVKRPDGTYGYQADFAPQAPLTLAAGESASTSYHLFAGAKEVHLLDRYERALGIPSFDKAVDFGWFYFLTKPIFYALDWLYRMTGNFGIAIILFTLFIKILFFPLANKSYQSMGKMRLLGPKIQALREQFKDDPARLQQEMLNLYRAEGVNPASGCLPMLIQVPVFFSLYKVIFVTIEMRQAPFFGWIHDLSAPDPTNVFNLFGLIPFDPGTLSPFLHVGAWPLIMGVSMYLQQKLNPSPPDPVQARMFQLMPVIFTFMLARFPAGLVIYWTTNNLLSIAQQWLIMRQARLATKPART
jgi:YidC/Oxa1 family membrane protein insertase